jgi:hypothetical protein
MKRKLPSASVEDADPITDQPIPATQTSASISPPAHEAHLRRKSWRQSGGGSGPTAQHLYECRDAEDLGLARDVIANTEHSAILTLFASEHEDNSDIWADFENVARDRGRKYRVFYLTGP